MNINVIGGTRDILVSEGISNFDKFNNTYGNFFSIPSMKIKNIYQSMDHISYLYDKRFLDLFIPMVVNDFAVADD